MDAGEYFQRIVVSNYVDFQQSPNDIRLLFNALVSMNTVPEFLALHRRGYALDISRDKLLEDAQGIRGELGLTALHFCANMFKHVRRIPHGSSEITASSTSISPDDQGTWTVLGHDLVEVVHEAFAKLEQEFDRLAPELHLFRWMTQTGQR
jgi:hypothetical protein